MTSKFSFPTTAWGAFSRQIRSGEDYIQVTQFGSFRYFAVFDGHGHCMAGEAKEDRFQENHVANYARNHLHKRIYDTFSVIDTSDIELVKTTLTDLFVAFDTEMYLNDIRYGSTCTLVLIDDKNDRIYQVNLGDSRSFIFIPGPEVHIISETVDHKPINSFEETRIVEAGGFVTRGRVNGDLMVARAFGDFELKGSKTKVFDPIHGKVSAVPDIIVTPKTESQYIILGSDGLYDRYGSNREIAGVFMSCQQDAKDLVENYDDLVHNKKAAEYLKKKLSREPDPDEIDIFIRKIDRITDDENLIYFPESHNDKFLHILAGYIVSKTCISDDISAIIVPVSGLSKDLSTESPTTLNTDKTLSDDSSVIILPAS